MGFAASSAARMTHTCLPRWPTTSPRGASCVHIFPQCNHVNALIWHARRVWHTGTMREMARFEDHSEFVTGVDFNLHVPGQVRAEDMLCSVVITPCS